MKNIQKFTLIELLVVVAILVILAAMLLPALQQARNQAHIAACKGNLRQIGIGVQVYSDEYSGNFPLYGLPTSNALDPKLYLRHPEFTAFARDYLQCREPDLTTSSRAVDYGILNCPGKRADIISFSRLYNVSYVTGEMIATHYAQYLTATGTIVLQATPNIKKELEAVHGPMSNYYADPARFTRASDPAAIPVFFDEAIASGFGGPQAAKPYNHGDIENPKLNVLYYDCSVELQTGDWGFWGDRYGIRRVDSNIFPAWYMPYPRMAPFPK